MAVCQVTSSETSAEQLELLRKLILCRQGRSGSPQDEGYVLERVNAAIDAALGAAPQQSTWLYYRIAMTADHSATAIPKHIVPVVDSLKKNLPIDGWWWLYKHDVLGSAIRLRLLVPRETAEQVDWEFQGKIATGGYGVNVMTYEPELRLFGGTAGMRVAHDFFCADSNFLGHWSALNEPLLHTILPAGTSVALILRLVRAAALDNFEAWDLFEKLAAARKYGSPQEPELRPYRAMMRAVLPSPDQVFALHCGGQSPLLQSFVEQIDVFGDTMRRLYFEGALECGLREYLTPLVLFHWNRAGFGARMQRDLALTLAEASGALIGRQTTHV